MSAGEVSADLNPVHVGLVAQIAGEYGVTTAFVPPRRPAPSLRETARRVSRPGAAAAKAALVVLAVICAFVAADSMGWISSPSVQFPFALLVSLAAMLVVAELAIFAWRESTGARSSA